MKDYTPDETTREEWLRRFMENCKLYGFEIEEEEAQDNNKVTITRQ